MPSVDLEKDARHKAILDNATLYLARDPSISAYMTIEGLLLIVNDLQPAAVSLRPEIELALEDVRHAGAEQAIVCGSGPTVAGVYWGDGARARAADVWCGARRSGAVGGRGSRCNRRRWT